MQTLRSLPLRIAPAFLSSVLTNPSETTYAGQQSQGTCMPPKRFRRVSLACPSSIHSTKLLYGGTVCCVEFCDFCGVTINSRRSISSFTLCVFGAWGSTMGGTRWLDNTNEGDNLHVVRWKSIYINNKTNKTQKGSNLLNPRLKYHTHPDPPHARGAGGIGYLTPEVTRP